MLKDWIKSKRKSRFSTDFINQKIHEKIEIVSADKKEGKDNPTFFDVFDENYNKIENKFFTSRKEAIAEANKYMRTH